MSDDDDIPGAFVPIAGGHWVLAVRPKLHQRARFASWLEYAPGWFIDPDLICAAVDETDEVV